MKVREAGPPCGDEAGLNCDQPQNTGDRKVPEEALECEEERTHGLPAGREQIELPAVHPVDERPDEETERDEWNRLRQPDGARPRGALRHLPDLEHHGDECHLAAEPGQGLTEPQPPELR